MASGPQVCTCHLYGVRTIVGVLPAWFRFAQYMLMGFVLFTGPKICTSHLYGVRTIVGFYRLGSDLLSTC